MYIIYRCLRVELMGQLVIMFCLTLILLNVMYVLAAQYDIVGKEEDKEAACVTVTGLLHVFALSGGYEAGGRGRENIDSQSLCMIYFTTNLIAIITLTHDCLHAH